MDSFAIGLIVFCILFSPLIFGIFKIFFKPNVKKEEPFLNKQNEPSPNKDRAASNNKSQNHVNSQLTSIKEIFPHKAELDQKEADELLKLLKIRLDERKLNTEAAEPVNPTHDEPKPVFNIWESPASPNKKIIKGTGDSYAQATPEMSKVVKQALISRLSNDNNPAKFYSGHDKLRFLPESELDYLLEKARCQSEIKSAYEVLNILLPHHFGTYFNLEYHQLKSWLPKEEEAISQKQKALQIVNINKDYNRSYIARAIVVCLLNWKDVMLATEYMELHNMLPYWDGRETVSLELEKIRWCAKYWFRTLAFDEKIKFTNDSQHVVVAGQAYFMEVPDKDVPERLRWHGKYESPTFKSFN